MTDTIKLTTEPTVKRGKTPKFLRLVACRLLCMSFFGCTYASMVVLENPEFPRVSSPAKINSEILQKYSVGKVLVEPRMFQGESNDDLFSLLVVFKANSTDCNPSVNDVQIAINGVLIEYDFPLGKTVKQEDWEVYSPAPSFWVCSIRGPIISPPAGEEMKKSRVDLSMVVSVEDKDGEITSKRIDSCFIPHKKSYVE